MKVKIVLLLIIFLFFSYSTQTIYSAEIYYDEQNNEFQYIIRKNDTLYEISRLLNINLAKLKKRNSELDPRNLKIGTEINISIDKDLNYHIVKPGDNIWKISQKTNLTAEDIIAYNQIENPDKIIPGEVILIPSIIKSNHNVKVMKFNKINNGVYVSGVARVFEATVNYVLETEYGKVLKKGFTTAAIGAPHWGKFEFEVCRIPNEAYYIVIFTTSAKDGSKQNEIKLQL
ncbi:MAG: LysM peptidoglycan-binding domain-containing protein [Halanaerobiales bacterium]|nr:LysM peptidoglycan-binding domain-containing protein [Halanaerobiales bacterium]